MYLENKSGLDNYKEAVCILSGGMDSVRYCFLFKKIGIGFIFDFF